eukprot:TRINITY_DN8949_c0_g1_i1.p1 TRINITY_DN8949_c0_g1~~TRINITY_DN8949_c0_g1_i1.p1  ORF type:complete len:349 (-),score=64.65 TRINITY_DN8949_c0_g1_i1:76-1122(-)
MIDFELNEMNENYLFSLERPLKADNKNMATDMMYPNHSMNYGTHFKPEPQYYHQETSKVRPLIDHYHPNMNYENQIYNTDFVANSPTFENEFYAEENRPMFPQTLPPQIYSPPVVSNDYNRNFSSPLFQQVVVPFSSFSAPIKKKVVQPKAVKKGRPRVVSKKRKAKKLAAKRKVRSKVGKNAIQCEGTNRKRNQRCRNAALMEFIGPRPKFCAEHINLDPDCLYRKCNSKYQKDVGDKKRCREIVLKEFGLCHKHYSDVIQLLVGNEGLVLARTKLTRVLDLLSNLEKEAISAKKVDSDLYQRKNKLIPKYQELKLLLSNRIMELENEPTDETIDKVKYEDIVGHKL